MNKAVSIYKDDGVGLPNARNLWNALKSLGYPLQWVDRNDLAHEGWESQTSALIIPGGRDVPYHQALTGSANERIRCYVMKGGSYLGICAGAYYGCSQIEFDIGQPLEVTGERALKFFPGVARGPAYGFGTFCYHSETGARVAKLGLDDRSILASYYNGGCYFVHAEEYDHVHVIARYLDLPGEPAAIVHCKVGKGTATLCGVHPEVSFNNIIHSNQQIKSDLEAVESERKNLLHLLLKLSIK